MDRKDSGFVAFVTKTPGEARPAARTNCSHFRMPQQPIDYQQFFENGPGLFLILEPTSPFRIVAVSNAYLKATGTTRANLVGQSVFDAFELGPGQLYSNVGEALRNSLETVVATHTSHAMPVQQYNISSSVSGSAEVRERHWSPVNVPILASDGSVQYIAHRVDDVTELTIARRTEQVERARLHEANNLFRAIYDQGLYAVHLDVNGIVLDVNRSSLEQCGFARSDVIGKPFWDCGWWNCDPELQGWIKRAVAQAASGTSVSGGTRFFVADCSERYADFSCMPIRDEHGVVQLIVATSLDITERARARKDLRATEILESIAEGFFSLDRDWRFTYMNRAAERILGRSREDLLDCNIWEEYPGLIGHAFETTYRQTMEQLTPATCVAHFADLDSWFDVRSYPAPNGISIYFRDVTDEKRSSAERDRIVHERESERRIFETALSNTPDLVYVFDLQHRFTYANEALLTMWGRTSQDALGKTCLELGYEPWHAEMHDREIEQVKATGKPIRGEVPFTGTNGRRIYDYIFAPVFGADGAVVAVAGTTRDVTERQQSELALREQSEQLREADRAKDEFLATLSHELRNPLAPLRNSLSVLRLSGQGEGNAAPVLEMMERQVNLLVRLVDDLLETARINRGSFALRQERLELATVVRNAVETSEPLIKAANHELRVHLPDTPIWLDGDNARLSQILSNLLNNAARYTNEGGRIELTATEQGGSVAISVRDNGVGMPAHVLPRIFEMFSRGERASLRAQGGLGIGLALSRRLAELHGGSVHAYSEGLGKGSEFILRLPVSANQNATETPAVLPDPNLEQGRVLVVDDNRDAATSLSMVLQFLGVDVRTAHDGREALEVFHAYQPSVVLLDIGMPGMDGYDVARTIRARFPDRPASIVALTGWGQDEDRRRAQEAGFDHHLVKPVDLSALRSLLAERHVIESR